MIDQARLNELKAEVGEDDFAEVVAIFCEEVEDVLNVLGAPGAHDFAGQLHFLKGSAVNLGLTQVGVLCLEAEERLKADPEFIPDIPRIRACFEASRQNLVSAG